MALKKKKFEDDEIDIFGEAVIYRRGDHWHFRLWLKSENKYARKSLNTTSQAAAYDRGKKLYHEIMGNLEVGKKYFSLSAKEGVKRFLEHRHKDIATQSIVVGRHGTITTHLEHWLDFVGRDTKLKDLGRTSCEDYFFDRNKRHGRPLAHATLHNEQGTINSMMKYLFRHNEVLIDSFDFPKLNPYKIDSSRIKRQTFEIDEYNRFTAAMRKYCERRRNNLDEHEWRMRQLMRHYFLIAANSGLRSGEQQKLRWSDVKVEDYAEGTTLHRKRLARINVRAITSKIKRHREFLCRGGYLFDRLPSFIEKRDVDALIFSLDGEKAISNRAIGYHFSNILKLAEIENYKSRNIVPYSLRHFMITQRVLSGLSFQQVAEMVGTSEYQIGKVYYHLNDDRRFTNATADYVRSKDGKITPI